MIAAFFKTKDGEFDTPAIAITLPMSFFGLYILFWMLPKFIRTGRVCINFGTWGNVHEIEREKNSKLFWFCIIVYHFGGLCCLIAAYVFASGKIRG